MINELRILAGVLQGERAYTGPLHALVEIINACNLNCLACWMHSPLQDRRREPWWKDWVKQRLSLEKFKELMDDLAGLNAERIEITANGEPFLHPNILEMIEYVKSKNLVCSVRTNGTLINRETLEALCDLGLDILEVSVWAGSAEAYMATHPNAREDTFHHFEDWMLYLQTLKGKTLRGNPMKLTLINVLFKNNYYDVPNMIHFALNVGAGRVVFLGADITENTRSLLLGEEERAVIIRDMEENKHLILRKKMDNNIGEFLKAMSGEKALKGHYTQGLSSEVPCYIGWVYTRIKVDGKVIPCCGCPELELGNLEEQRFREVWKSHEYREFRRKAKRSVNDPYFSECSCIENCPHLYINSRIDDIVRLRRYRF